MITSRALLRLMTFVVFYVTYSLSVLYLTYAYVHLFILNGPGTVRVYTATVYITYSIPGLRRRDGGAESVN